MTKTEIILASVVIFQWLYIIFLNYMFKVRVENLHPTPIKETVKQMLGIKTKAWIPHKDEGRILDGIANEPNFK